MARKTPPDLIFVGWVFASRPQLLLNQRVLEVTTSRMGDTNMNMKCALLLSLLSLSSATAYAGATFTNVTIAKVAVYTSGGPASKGYLVVTFSMPGTGTPPCANGWPQNLAIDLSTAGGTMAAQMVQQAYLSGAVVTAIGTDDCNVLSTSATMGSIQSSRPR